MFDHIHDYFTQPMMMPTLLWRSSLRSLLKHPWQFALSVLGVLLGVAIVVAIDLANASARRAFQLSSEAATGKATHSIACGTQGFADTLYRHLLVEQAIRPLAPVVEGDVLIERVERVSTDAKGEQASNNATKPRPFRLVGVDVFAERPFRPYLSPSNDNTPSTTNRQAERVDATTLLSKPNTAVLTAQTAQELGAQLGDTLLCARAGKRFRLTLAALIRPSDERSSDALSSIVIADIGVAQEVLSMQGRLSRIDCLLSNDEWGARTTERLQAALPQGVELTRATARPKRVEDMARAFDLNLTALSLLALMVGMFIIYNTMTFAVVQRRLSIGIFRALGVTRSEIFRLVVGEALLIGVVGTSLGVALGILLGRGLVGLVTQTINDLYFVVSVRQLDVPPLLLLKGFALGVVGVLAATLAPAHEATKAPPKAVLSRSQVETTLRAALPKLSAAAFAALLLGAAVLLVPSNSIFVSYGGLFVVLVGCALSVPALTVVLMSAFRPLAARMLGVLGSMAARAVVASLSRTAVAIAALMVAVSATVGVGVMVQSFRQTVVQWLSSTLNADVYVSPPNLVARRGESAIDSALVAALVRCEGVAEASYFRTMLAELRSVSTDGTTTTTPRLAQIMAVQMSSRAYSRYTLKRAEPDVWQRLEAGEVLVSEAFAFHNNVELGSVLTLQTDAGERTFRVAGIYFDYASDVGIVFMAHSVFKRWWNDTSISGISLYAASGVSSDTLLQRCSALSAGKQDLLIRSNARLLGQSLEIFDRTFAITDVLRLLTVGVAFVGVLSALMALQLERTRELGILRANGLTPMQVWRLVTLQTGFLGVIAGLLALPVGLMLAFVLIYVINQRSFGWTLQMSFQPAVLAQAVLLAVLAAVLAGLYPAWKMSRVSPAAALREE
jgi:putative ABC transport system permease protein